MCEELKGELTKLDHEYHVLDLVSETLVNSIHRLQNEATTLEKALLHASSTNSRTSNIVNHLTASKTVNKKNPERIKEDQVLKRLEAALFDSDDSDEDFDGDNEISCHENSLNKAEASGGPSSTAALKPQRKKHKVDIGEDHLEIDSKKENAGINSSNASGSSSESEIDEDKLFELI